VHYVDDVARVCPNHARVNSWQLVTFTTTHGFFSQLIKGVMFFFTTMIITSSC
jgi:hypothetical protein